ncbi:MAG TPA: hypothetical protein VK517_09925 [Cyclobacteriaceae bacterium]|nr:hypothetical protein [Cyclobacteriaceae bacterium]
MSAARAGLNFFVIIFGGLGLPLSMYLMHHWLSRFAYQATIGWFVFAGSALLLLTLTCLTVGIESIQTALKNPVEAIRHE